MKVFVVLIFLLALSFTSPSPLPEVISKSSKNLPAVPASTGSEIVPAKPTKPPKATKKPDYFFIPPCVYCAREQKSAAEKHDSV
ncbi:hypothetical protein OUZ56_002731 [Daphnia magna]|uniref:Uncharacterized protein n=1 Tax=Daphnia magna TaxID=35525 RepID=A0ABR0A6L7_9CRUS|nr:hypothetical protein OUZ56_002731 [Daphnia magna]